MTKNLIELLLAVCIPVAGAMGYVHGTFVTKGSFNELKSVVNRVDKVLCKIAIKQKLDNADDICTID